MKVKAVADQVNERYFFMNENMFMAQIFINFIIPLVFVIEITLKK